MTTANETSEWGCEICQDGTQQLYPSIFQADPDEISVQNLDDSSAKQYFEFPFDNCPVCGRPYGT